jgi:hypothetical protein
MKARFLPAALATVCCLSIPGAAWADGPRWGRAPAPNDQEPAAPEGGERQRKQDPTEKRRSVPAAAPASPVAPPYVAAPPVDVPPLPPCPVTMVLIAPFGYDCVVTLSPAPFWFDYAGYPYSKNSHGRRSARSRLDQSSSAPLSRQNGADLLRPQVEPQTAPEPQPVSYEPYVPGKPGPPKTFYVIPGCYAGDRPPQSVALPPGCDISQLHSY